MSIWDKLELFGKKHSSLKKKNASVRFTYKEISKVFFSIID